MRLDATIAATALCCAVCCNLKNSSIKEASEKYSHGSSDYMRGMGELKMQTKWDSACHFQPLLLSIYLLLIEITWNVNLQLPTWAKTI